MCGFGFFGAIEIDISEMSPTLALPDCRRCSSAARTGLFVIPDRFGELLITSAGGPAERMEQAIRIEAETKEGIAGVVGLGSGRRKITVTSGRGVAEEPSPALRTATRAPVPLGRAR